MSICMLYNYKVKFKQKRSYPEYQAGDNPALENPSFTTETSRWQRTMPGCELLDFIMKTTKDTDMFEIHFGTNDVVIELFDPWDGSSSDITISWEEKDEYKNSKKH